MQLDAQAVRIHAYEHLFENGVPPTSVEIARHFGVKPADSLRVLREMRIGKAILPHPSTGEIWMAGPFASLPTQYTVVGQTGSWWANCAWDMLGVAQLVSERVRIETKCEDCGERMTFKVEPGAREIQDDAVVHFLVPARRWYDDIGFT
jgi:hypothetical protein